MHVIILGGTGMVGAGVLMECLDDPRVRSVLVIGRRSVGRAHPRLREVVRASVGAVEDLRDEFARADACFFCLGVSAVGMSEPEYSRLTFDLTLAVARTMAAANPAMTFCYVSGAGTDSTERGRAMWARVKGRTENALLALPFRAFMFRPGFIQPVKGVRSSTGWYRAFYAVTAPLYPVLRRLMPGITTTTAALGKAMLAVAAHGSDVTVLDSRAINRLAAGP